MFFVDAVLWHTTRGRGVMLLLVHSFFVCFSFLFFINVEMVNLEEQGAQIVSAFFSYS